jgi:TonB family protein
MVLRREVSAAGCSVPGKAPVNAMIRRYPRVRSTSRQWAVIIVSVVLVHAAFVLFFKTRYLTAFKTQIPVSEEGEPRYPFLDNPLHVISLAPEPRTRESRTREKATEEKSIAEAPSESVVGEPQSEILPISPNGSRGSHGREGSRRATVEPKPLYIPWPKYPAGIKEIPEGSVELMLLINEKGEVEDVTIARKLPIAELNQIAVEAARKIRFTPGMIQGVRAPMWVRLTISFQPR